MSAAELRAELKALRKEHPDHAPVSKMHKKDVAAAIQRLKVMREETPAPAATRSAPLAKSKSAVESIKAAKAAEFPVEPTHAVHKSASSTKKGETRKTARKAYEPVTKAEVKEEVKSLAKKEKKKVVVEEPAPKGKKPAKGSPEMRERMAKLRAMRKKKE